MPVVICYLIVLHLGFGKMNVPRMECYLALDGTLHNRHVPFEALRTTLGFMLVLSAC